MTIIQQLIQLLVSLALLWVVFAACCHIVGLRRVPGEILRSVGRPLGQLIEGLIIWALRLPFRIIGGVWRSLRQR
ncbi:MAG: hypothetical protein AAB490_03825 [Patescibacteria group bacterium]